MSDKKLTKEKIHALKEKTKQKEKQTIYKEHDLQRTK